MATNIPSRTFDLVHLPLREPKLSGHCIVSMLTGFDLAFTTNVGFRAYRGETNPDDLRMAAINMGRLVSFSPRDFDIEAFEELPSDEVCAVALRHNGSFYWLLYNPFSLNTWLDPSLLYPCEVLPKYLRELHASPSLYVPVGFDNA